MAGSNALPPEFTQWVRNILVHLYDHPYLQNHPLALQLYADAADGVTRAQCLRRALLGCLEELEPQGREGVAVEANRAYAVLTYRYVDGLAIGEIAAELALSERQTYREHDKGIKAVARLLWDRLGGDPGISPAPQQDGPEDRTRAAQEEAERLQRAVQAEALDVAQVLAPALRVVEPLARQRGIEIELQPLERPCPPVWADRTMLRQVLLNLLGYALDRSIQGVLRMQVGDDGAALVLAIQATPGQGQAVDPSSSPDRSTINLDVARSLIEAQGGGLEVGDDERGWCARVVLPTRGRASILVIDDNVDLISLLQRYLGGHRVSVTGCPDSDQALRLAAETQPQAILLDIMMPTTDGWELLLRLRGSPQTCETPVIICSVLNHRDMALTLGASDYLVKPVSQVALLACLRRWLGPLLPQEQPPAGPPSAPSRLW